MSQEDRARTAAYVKARRGQLGLKSQQQLAKLAGVNLNTINTLETGNRWPQAATLAQVEQALGLRSGSLQAVHDGREPVPLDKEEDAEQASADRDDPYIAQIRAIEGLDDDERDLLVRYARHLLETRRTLTKKAERGTEGRKGA